MDAAVTLNASADDAGDGSAGRTGGYRRSAGSPRGEARRRELLARVTDDLAANGLVDFSLRRAARAAGTTHKVLLYHFESAEDLLRQAVFKLRERRIVDALGPVAHLPADTTLAIRLRAVWPVLLNEELHLRRVLDQAMGLTMYDPARYGELGREASLQYLPELVSLCPAHWAEQRKLAVSQMILATLRGFLIERLTTGETAGIAEGFESLVHAVEREEAADD
jgi:AcrR family transcriptional regulator